MQQIKRCRLVRDFITGFSRGYCFVEYANRSDAKYAINKLNHTVLDDRTIIVMFECERNLPGWIPRRLGGGLGGKKESGQLRFGGVERPFRKPILIPSRCGFDMTTYNDIGKTTIQVQDYDHEKNGNKYLHLFPSNMSGEDIKSSRVESDREGKERRNKSQERNYASIKNSTLARKHNSHYHNSDKRIGSDRLDNDVTHKKHSAGSKSRKRSRSRDSSQRRIRNNTYSRKTQNSKSSHEMFTKHDNEKTTKSSHNRNSSRYKDDVTLMRKNSGSSRRFVRSQLSLTPEWIAFCWSIQKLFDLPDCLNNTITHNNTYIARTVSYQLKY